MHEEHTSIPYIIVGAGIIGLQIAYELIKKGVRAENIALFDQNLYPGEHSSSRNSGVLHAGLYYPADSKKQIYCLEGNSLWGEMSNELGFKILRPGKYVVATSKSDVDELEKLFEFARQKNVPGLTWNTSSEIKNFVNVEKAFFSKFTGVVSPSEIINCLRNYLERKGVILLLNQRIDHIDVRSNCFEVFVNREVITCNFVVNCAGLFGISLRKKMGLFDLEDLWVKGRYLRLKKKFYNESLIYPLPPSDLAGLGVHTSFDVDGIVRFGPDTEKVNQIDYSIPETLVDEQYPAISKLFKGISKEELLPDYCGIRSKIIHNGQRYNDFWIESPIKGYWETLGIESPGLTSSPAIAKFLVRKLLG